MNGSTMSIRISAMADGLRTQRSSTLCLLLVLLLLTSTILGADQKTAGISGVWANKVAGTSLPTSFGARKSGTPDPPVRRTCR